MVRTVEHLKTNPQDKPLEDCVISDCGELKPGDDDGVPAPQVSLKSSHTSLSYLLTGRRVARRTETFGLTGRVPAPPREQLVAVLWRCGWALTSVFAASPPTEDQPDVTSLEQKLEVANKVRAIGNDYFKNKDYATAVRKYEKVRPSTVQRPPHFDCRIHKMESHSAVRLCVTSARRRPS